MVAGEQAIKGGRQVFEAFDTCFLKHGLARFHSRPNNPQHFVHTVYVFPCKRTENGPEWISV